MRPVWLASGGLLAALVCTQGPPGLALLLAASGIAGSLLAAASRRPAMAAVLVGIAVIALRVVLGDLLREPPTAVEASTEGRWSAQVLAVASPRDGEQRATLGLDLADRSAVLVVYASLPRYPPLTSGDRLQVDGVLRPPPRDGGFADYLRRNGISATLQGRSMELGASGDALQGLRRQLDELLAKVLPEPHAGLASGLLVGLRERVDRDLAADFTTAGVSHVVAISGWNIALVGGLVGALTRPLGRRPRSLLIVAVVAFYTVIAGASASVVRAALMAAVVLLARESGRRGQAAGALGLAACAMLLLDPSTVTDPGFQLSLAATGGLLAWGEPLRQGLVRRLPALPDWLVESLAISLAAQAATLPLVLLTFGRLSLVAPLANLLMAPVVAPAMLAGFVALLAGGLAALGAPAALIAVGSAVGWAVLGAMIAVARLAAAVPLASVELPEPWGGISAAIAAMLLVLVGSRRGRERVAGLWALARRGAAGSRDRATGSSTHGSAMAGSPVPARRALHGSRDRRPALAGLLAGVVLLAAVGFAAAARPEARLRMTVLDVGQGDAVLLEGPAGGRILVDGGPDPDLLLRQLDARLPAWDRRLDLLILTHPHEDHVAGLALLLDRYRVSATAEPGMLGPGPGYAAFRAALRRSALPHRSLFRGDRLSLDGARIEVAWPIAGTVPERPPDDGTGINNVSIVLDVRFGHRRWLLNGDVEEEVDPSLLAGGLGGRVDVLKVAHHGSRTASTAAFLEAVRPAVAIVSAGNGNPYGHPAAATLDRLRAAGARVLRTDQDGSVTVSTDGEDQRLAVSGPRRESGWPPAVALRTGRVAAGRTPATALAGWSCGVPRAPRIARWSSPIGTKPPASSLDSIRPTGTWPTPPRSPTWPPTWRNGRPAAVGPSTGGWSRPPPFSTTSTSSSRRPSAAASATVRRVPAG